MKKISTVSPETHDVADALSVREKQTQEDIERVATIIAELQRNIPERAQRFDSISSASFGKC